MRGTSSNPRLLCAFHGLQMSLFPMAVITVFWQRQIGMDMTRILGLQAVFGLAMALFEVPSGVLADRIGYRRTLLVASLASIAGWSVYSVADRFSHVLVAEVILGIGMSMVSGADSALLYESLVEAGQEGGFARWTGLMRFWGQLGEGSAALVAGLLYALSPRAPFVVEVGVWLVATFLVWRMREPAAGRQAPAGARPDPWRILRTVRASRPLRDVGALMVVLGLSSFVPVWTIQLYAVEAGLPEVALGLLWAGANYSVALASLGSSRLKERIGLFPLLALCLVLVFAGYLGLGVSTAVWGFAFYYLLTVMRGLFHPALHHEEQRLVPSADRAGLISLRSLVFRSTFLVLGPLVGIGMDAWGQRPVLLVLGALLGTTGSVAWWRLRRSLPTLSFRDGAAPRAGTEESEIRARSPTSE